MGPMDWKNPWHMVMSDLFISSWMRMISPSMVLSKRAFPSWEWVAHSLIRSDHFFGLWKMNLTLSWESPYMNLTVSIQHDRTPSLGLEPWTSLTSHRNIPLSWYISSLPLLLRYRSHTFVGENYPFDTRCGFSTITVFSIMISFSPLWKSGK